MSAQPYQALYKMKNLIECGDTPEKLAEQYDKWANEYEKDVSAIGYSIPQKAAKILLHHLNEITSSKPKVMDIACGTGLVGKALRNLGFHGILHGIDGSEKMVNIAQEHKMYDNLSVQFVVPQREIQMESSEKYDAVICLGAFTKNHLDPEVVLKLYDIVLPGGLLVFSVRRSVDNQELFERLLRHVESLKEAGAMEQISLTTASHAVNWDGKNASEENEPSQASDLWIYCLRKI